MRAFAIVIDKRQRKTIFKEGLKVLVRRLRTT